MDTEEKVEEEVESGDLFREISRWVESTQSRLHSPTPSPLLEPRSPSCYTSSPPLPLSPTEKPTPVFHYTEIVQPPSPDYDEGFRSPLPPNTSSSNSLPSLVPSSPTCIILPQSPATVSRPTSPLFPPQQSSQNSSSSSISQSVNDGSLESIPVRQKEQLFNLDVFISKALKLCRQTKDKAEGKKGKDGGWKEETKQTSIKYKVPRLPEHKTPQS